MVVVGVREEEERTGHHGEDKEGYGIRPLLKSQQRRKK